MALLLRCIPFKSHIENNHTILTFQNPSQTSFSSSHHNISRIRRKPNLLSSSTSSSSITAVVGATETESENETRTKLIAQNIPWTCNGGDIRSLFQKYGTVMDVELSMHNKTRNRGLAFVTMGSEEEALAALTGLNSYEFEGRVIKVDFARTQKKKMSNQPMVTVPKHNMFVANLSWKVKSKDLKEFFSSMNCNVVAAKIIHQSSDRKPTGYGFVSFASKEEAKAAISSFQGKILMGRAIRLGKSRRDVEEESKDDDVEVEETSTKVNGDRGQSDKAGET